MQKTSEQLELEAEGFALADKIRTDHNGVFGVRLFMGHDGHNHCSLENYEETVGVGESGRSMLEAVQRAAADWYFKRFLPENIARSVSHKDALEEALQRAVDDMGDKGDGLFCSAGFCAVMNEGRPEYGVLSQIQCEQILLSCPRVVQLKHGSMWIRLPKDYTRFEVESK